MRGIANSKAGGVKCGAILALALSLCGCATYDYQRTGATTYSLKVNTLMRELPAGGALGIGADGSVNGSVAALTHSGGPVMDALGQVLLQQLMAGRLQLPPVTTIPAPIAPVATVEPPK